jgi:hypothetical protein
LYWILQTEAKILLELCKGNQFLANRCARLQKLPILDLNVISFQSFDGLSEKAYNTPLPTHKHTHTEEIIPESFWTGHKMTRLRTELFC